MPQPCICTCGISSLWPSLASVHGVCRLLVLMIFSCMFCVSDSSCQCDQISGRNQLMEGGFILSDGLRGSQSVTAGKAKWEA